MLLELRGLGRRTRNSTRPPMMIPTMIKTRRGLGKLVLFSGGTDGGSMVGWMHDRGLRFIAPDSRAETSLL